MIQNSTKNYIKQFKIYKTDAQKSLTVLGNILEQHEQWRRVFPRATATGGAWIHAPPRKQPGNRAVKVGFFSSVFLRRR
jgi:hypothetical protein